jgi:hypothetical protein
MIMTVPMVKDFKSGLPAIKKVNKDTFASLLPIGNSYLGEFMANCPFKIPKLTLDQSTNLITTGFSNMYASKVPFKWDDKKLLNQFYFATSGGSLCNALTSCTVGDKVGIACFADKSQIEKPQEMIDLILIKNEEVLKSA